MKRAIALLLMLACLLTISACGKKIYFDEEEYYSDLAESSSKAEVESSKQDKDISEAVEDTLDKIGKTEKGKKLVALYDYGDMKEYHVVEFKKGISVTKYMYRYCKTDSRYNTLISVTPEGNFKITGKDPHLRLVEYKSTDISELDFDTYYALYARKDIVTIIE